MNVEFPMGSGRLKDMQAAPSNIRSRRRSESECSAVQPEFPMGSGCIKDMQAAPSNIRSPILSDSQRFALISLLVDDDPAIYRTIREKLLSYGEAAVVWLRPYLLSGDAMMRRRSLEIVHYLARRNTDERFLAFCLNNGEEFDLEVAT